MTHNSFLSLLLAIIGDGAGCQQVVDEPAEITSSDSSSDGGDVDWDTPVTSVNITPHAWNQLHWYKNISETDRIKLREALCKIDEGCRLDPKNNKIQRMNEDMEHIMTDIVRRIGEAELRFRGVLFKMGSAHNQTKIIEPNEYDFSVELNVDTLFGNKMSIHMVLPHNIYQTSILMVGGPLEETDKVIQVDGIVFRSLTETWMDPNLNELVEGYKSPGFCYFKVISVTTIFLQLLQSVVPHADLPPNWSHGGFNKPNFSGIRMNLPACLLQFEYKEPGDSRGIDVSVDLAPVLKVPVQSLGYARYLMRDVVQDHVFDKGLVKHAWVRLSKTRLGMDYSWAEEEWLRTYGFVSIPKQVIRIVKAIQAKLGLETERNLPKSLAVLITKYQSEKSHGRESGDSFENAMAKFVEMVGQKYDQSLALYENVEFAKFKDIGENIGSKTCLSSYKVKRVVLSMMALDPDEGRNWTADDLPERVLSTLMILHDLQLHCFQIERFLDYTLDEDVHLHTYVPPSDDETKEIDHEEESNCIETAAKTCVQTDGNREGTDKRDVINDSELVASTSSLNEEGQDDTATRKYVVRFYKNPLISPLDQLVHLSMVPKY